VRSIFFSPRARRRLAWTGAGLAIVVGVVAVGVLWPNTGERTPEVFSGEQAQVYREPKAVELTRAERARALAAAANFVTHAVARRNVGRSYELAAPTLRAGLTKAQWSKGTIPVVPFPVEEARWKIEYRYPDALGLQVLLFPTAKSRLRPAVFAMELMPRGHGRKQRWLVSSWSPTGVQGGSGVASAPRVTRAGGVQNIGATLSGGDARLDARWLLAPLGLLALVPVIVAGFYVRGWRRGRKAEAAYHTRRA
jgi:hypothetical protein